MLFNSFEFLLVFLPVVFAGYAILRPADDRYTMAWILLASLIFYTWWKPSYTPILLISISFNFLIGRLLSAQPSIPLLSGGIFMNLALLSYYKYAGFFVGLVSDISGLVFSNFTILLPLAISFFTFQQIAYLVDCHRQKVVKHNFLSYAVFVTFFPQLIAGPIVHQAQMLPQFLQRKKRIDLVLIAEGLTFIGLGLIKKVLIADNIAEFSTTIFDAALLPGANITFFEGWMGALAYTFQIYFDFSGYCDMAVGAALLFGIRIPFNFASPYKAINIIDFWRRWHMTLSIFLRDYLYYPLGGNRKGPLRRYLNLAIVMALGGLWHGAGWTFVFWGCLHGAYLIVNHAWVSIRGNAVAPGYTESAISWLLTFLAVVIAWVFFRAESFTAAQEVLKGMAGLNGFVLGKNHESYLGPLAHGLSILGVEYTSRSLFSMFSVIWFFFLFPFILLLPNSQEWLSENSRAPSPIGKFSLRYWHNAIPVWKANALWGSVVAIALVAGIGWLGGPSEFLYFNF